MISAADPSIGQIPQTHLAALDAIRFAGSEAQKKMWFVRVLRGYCLGNAFSEAKSKHVGAFETTLTPNGDGYVVNGEKFYATGALLAHFIHIGAVGPDGKVYLAIASRDAPGRRIALARDATRGPISQPRRGRSTERRRRGMMRARNQAQGWRRKPLASNGDA